MPSSNFRHYPGTDCFPRFKGQHTHLQQSAVSSELRGQSNYTDIYTYTEPQLKLVWWPKHHCGRVTWSRECLPRRPFLPVQQLSNLTSSPHLLRSNESSKYRATALERSGGRTAAPEEWITTNSICYVWARLNFTLSLNSTRIRCHTLQRVSDVRTTVRPPRSPPYLPAFHALPWLVRISERVSLAD